MGEVSVVELLATEYPDVNFIIPHLGSFADDWRAQLALIDHLVRHPNIYTDTAGVRRFDLFEQPWNAPARENLVRLRWPMAASRSRTRKNICARSSRRSRTSSCSETTFLVSFRALDATQFLDVTGSTRAASGVTVDRESRDPWAAEQFPCC